MPQVRSPVRIVLIALGFLGVALLSWVEISRLIEQSRYYANYALKRERDEKACLSRAAFYERKARSQREHIAQHRAAYIKNNPGREAYAESGLKPYLDHLAEWERHGAEARERAALHAALKAAARRVAARPWRPMEEVPGTPVDLDPKYEDLRWKGFFY